jgi:hypothetical protein
MAVVEEPAQACSEMVPPLVTATVHPLQVLDASSVNIALASIQDELAVTPAHRPGPSTPRPAASGTRDSRDTPTNPTRIAT